MSEAGIPEKKGTLETCFSKKVGVVVEGLGLDGAE